MSTQAIKVDTYQNLVGNRWTSSRNGATFEDENPARRGSSLARFQSSTPQDITLAIDVAAKAFRSWRSSSLAERQKLTGRFLELLERSCEELALIVARENGKTIPPQTVLIALVFKLDAAGKRDPESLWLPPAVNLGWYRSHPPAPSSASSSSTWHVTPGQAHVTTRQV